MKPRISIGTCQRAVSIVERARQTVDVGIPVMIRGEEVLITRGLRVQEKHWVCGDIRLSRVSQEELTRKAHAIIAEDERQFLERFPPRPPTISIQECQEAIEIAGPFPSPFGARRCGSPSSPLGISASGSAEISGSRPKRKNSSPTRPAPSLRARTWHPNNPFPALRGLFAPCWASGLFFNRQKRHRTRSPTAKPGSGPALKLG